MNITYREIKPIDVKELISLRSKTREHSISVEELRNMGITKESVIAKIQSNYKGWLCECDNRIVGFTMGNKDTGEVWVIAILPEYEGKGIGQKLMALIKEWLFQFNDTLWLTTDDDSQFRAYKFYWKNGWTKTGTHGFGKICTFTIKK